MIKNLGFIALGFVFSLTFSAFAQEVIGPIEVVQAPGQFQKDFGTFKTEYSVEELQLVELREINDNLSQIHKLLWSKR